MIRKINRIVALILIVASMSTVVPFDSVKVNAAEGGKVKENVLSSDSESLTDEQIFIAIKSKLDEKYAGEDCIVLADSTPVKTISLDIDSDTASKMIDSIVTDSFVKEKVKEQLIQAIKKQYKTDTLPKEVIDQINKYVDNMGDMFDKYKETIKNEMNAQLESLIGKDIPIYAFKAVDKEDMKTVKDQGYFVGGTVGYEYMQNEGKPLVVSASQLDDTVIGKIIQEIKDKIGDFVSNINSEINKIVDSTTGIIDKISDSFDDLTDKIKDKNDDLDNAWDKVFDRFDNDPGWRKKDGYIYYYDKDGVSVKGAQKIKGKTYYFNRIDGAMETGWQVVDGKRCYFDKKKGYELFNQWIQDGDDWYYVGQDGTVIKMDWVQDAGKYYYLKADGKMAKGWLKVDDYWYYFNENGSMAASTWMYSKGKWYYLKDNGQTANDWTQVGDKSYYFKDPSGEMQTGWFRADGNWYCSNDDGSMKTGWAESKDGWCYLDDSTGIMKKNEWVTVNGKTYYFNINGAMVTGSRYIDGTKYVFSADGTLRN